MFLFNFEPMSYISKNSSKSTSAVDEEIQNMAERYVSKEHKLNSFVWLYVLIAILATVLISFSFV